MRLSSEASRIPRIGFGWDSHEFRPGIPLNDIVDGVVAYFQDKANAAVGTVVGSSASYPMAAKASAD